MSKARRLIDAVVGQLPVPDELADEGRPVDPRVDPAALEAFGERQLAQFGPGQQHSGSAPLPTHFALADAERARLELERQASAADTPDHDAGGGERDEREACP